MINLSELLVLSRADVESLLTMEDSINAMEQVFAASSNNLADSVGVMHIDAAKFRGGWAVKPGYLADKGYVAVKLVGVYPGNAAKGIPSILGAILLSDASNGSPLAVLDGGYITGVRTGATGAVAAKHLARKDSKAVGIVGAGTQGRMQALGLKNVVTLAEVRAYDVDQGALLRYSQEMGPKLGVKVTAVNSPEAAVRGADIVVTVTPSRKPYLKNEWIAKGTHINAFGADSHGKQELEQQVYKKSKLFVDKLEVSLEKGLYKKGDIYGELGDVITGKRKGRENPAEVTIFDSTGLGIQDAAAASIVYEKAKKQGTGTWAKFI